MIEVGLGLDLHSCIVVTVQRNHSGMSCQHAIRVKFRPWYRTLPPECTPFGQKRKTPSGYTPVHSVGLYTIRHPTIHLEGQRWVKVGAGIELSIIYGCEQNTLKLALPRALERRRGDKKEEGGRSIVGL